ncbi:M20/M25/M40 family metallo-hydrolase [Streptomyces griseorubiginosus]|uniref:M20/M25/M40 family metallo-hydrolase n=1 Tax=Streptomyces griseorubiginosus TaxID=67304 RepID=UPI00076C5A30|nr:M20/M25/M40 family metallo-hydrolase [Streptomyces griseorubiginosus]KUM81592.1 aminopeptidase [Streptomyces griseorubiginosus]
MASRPFLRRASVGVLCVGLFGAAPVGLFGAAPVGASPRVPGPPVVTAQRVMPYLKGFQSIADRNGGNRAHGTPGYRESVTYVRRVLDEAGYRTTLQPFSHDGATGYNVIADWPGGDTRKTVLVGAHLDSVLAGPGINDNGSGSAAVLATAVAVAKAHLSTERHLRFAWWGAEEGGLFGSAHYVNSLSPAERSSVHSYLNFDQAGSRNTTTWLVTHDPAGSEGAQEATEAFERYFAARSIPTFDIGDTGSDDQSFAAAGIPVAGFTTGISDCIHSACDDIHNVDPAVQTASTNAVLDVTWQLAVTKDRR